MYLQVKISIEPTVGVISSFCECKAGNGHCSHMVGLLYMASHYSSMGYKSVPPVLSRTSAPQQWHVPSRAAGLSAKMVDTVVISKVKPPKRSADSSPISKPKRRRVFEGVIPNVYCPITEPAPDVYVQFAKQLHSNLSNIASDAQILSLLPHPDDDNCFAMSATIFGDVPSGSCLSQQQKIDPNESTDIINIITAPPFPPFPLPELPMTYNNYYDILLNTI